MINHYVLSSDSVKVEETTTSLIREYLAKKGFKRTLETLDIESPRNDKSISSRAKLVDYLRITNLYEFNKNSTNKTYTTILELLTSYLMSNEIIQMGSTQSKTNASMCKNDVIIHDAENEGDLSVGSEKRFDAKLQETKTNNDAKLMSSMIKKVTNNESKKRLTFDTKSEDKPIIDVKLTPKLKDNEVAAPLIETNNLTNDDEFDKLLAMKKNKVNVKREVSIEQYESQSKELEQPKSQQQSESKKEILIEEPKAEIAYRRKIESSPKEKIITPSAHALRQDYRIVPIDFDLACSLKTLLFGQLNINFNDEWKYQSFKFCDYVKLKYGLVQKRGGPCGVMASVQAYLLIELLYSSSNSALISTDLFDVSKRDRSKLLAQALAKLLWKCGEESQEACVCVPTQKAHFAAPNGKYRGDSITETLNLLYFDNQKNLETFLIKNVAVFENEDSSGCILLLYSAIFSRTIKKIQQDMDEPTGKLMGQHFYCTQDMVNLLIHGKAFSNVFNDVVYLDTLKLRGPTKRNDIGLLSLFEHFKSCEVGSYFKTPKYPLWIVCSESHFSIIFSLKKEILNDWKAENRFELYYYDGLANQHEQIRLTISAPTNYFTNRKSSKHIKDESTPPLELVIRTKWKDADIDWNGTEPIL